MSHLLIEIGNTALKAAWADGMTLGKTFRYQGERKIDFILSLVEKEYPEVMIVASVYDISQYDEKKLKKYCDKLEILDSKHNSIIEKADLPTYLTYDRVASIIASRYLFKGKNCTIFDFGTTLTTDSIDAEGNYIEGHISLGCRTRFKALNRYSKTLPLVNIPGDLPEKTDSLKSSIETGIISGIMFEIQGWMNKQHSDIIVFTGGDAIYFAKRMKNSIFVVCNLVLMGLAIIAKNYVKEDF